MLNRTSILLTLVVLVYGLGLGAAGHASNDAFIDPSMRKRSAPPSSANNSNPASTAGLPVIHFADWDDAEEAKTVSRYSEVLSRSRRYLVKQKHLSAPEMAPSSSCYKTYNGFYNTDQITIRVAWGYEDLTPNNVSVDRLEKIALVNQLTSSCETGFSACGFTETVPDNLNGPSVYSKMIAGPDGRPHRVTIYITYSSESTFSAKNLVSPGQAKASKRSRRNFVNGLMNSDVVFYSGHSRDGGGPDFDPPHLGSDQEVNYGWYNQFPAGTRLMAWALANATHRPKLIGMYSCKSKKHFLDLFDRLSPDSCRILTGNAEVDFEPTNQAILASLNSLLGMWCAKDMQKGIQFPVGKGLPTLGNFFVPGTDDLRTAAIQANASFDPKTAQPVTPIQRSTVLPVPAPVISVPLNPNAPAIQSDPEHSEEISSY